jgi:hypothetical protein
MKPLMKYCTVLISSFWVQSKSEISITSMQIFEVLPLNLTAYPR